MKALFVCLSLTFTGLVCGTPSLHAQTKTAQKTAAEESLGKLALEQRAAAVEKIMGKPESKGKDRLMEATGEWVQDWNYPSQGLVLGMASTKQHGAKTISIIRATEKCQLATSRGIKIGSTEAEVKKAYAKQQDKENSRAGVTFVAGSIYGGVMFAFKNGKVTEIFLGASAE